MNITRSLSLILASVFSCHGEIFISSTNQANSLTIASNEVLLISSAMHAGIVNRSSFSPTIDAPEVQAWITIAGNAGADLPFRFDKKAQHGPLAIAGPAQLKFHLNTTESDPLLISFDRVQGSAIHSVYVTNSAAQPLQSSPTIDVPAGKTCHFFPPIFTTASYDYNVAVTVISGTNMVPLLSLKGGEEFAGPVTLSLTYISDLAQGTPDGAIVSYYFNEDSIVLPEMKLVAGPTGSFAITVEKSTDLTNWHPVAVQTTSSDRQTYYRLRITR
jgi:hypothetical protein